MKNVPCLEDKVELSGRGAAAPALAAAQPGGEPSREPAAPAALAAQL